MNLRRLAQGRPCQVRLPNFCNHNPGTVVLAHFRLVGLSGMNLKSPDLIGAWACSSCHDVVDRRRFVEGLDPSFVRLAHALGVFRTQQILLDEGLVVIKVAA